MGTEARRVWPSLPGDRRRMTPPRPDPRLSDDPTAAGPEATSGTAPEIALFSNDPELLRQLRAAAPSLSIIHARNTATLINVLRAGQCAALVMDAGTAGPAAVVAVMRLYQHFPLLPVIAVGTREDETRLGHLISAGRIYRFLHRPVSGARARKFLEASLQRHAGLRGRSAETLARAGGWRPLARALVDRRFLITAGSVLIVAGAALWYLRQH